MSRNCNKNCPYDDMEKKDFIDEIESLKREVNNLETEFEDKKCKLRWAKEDLKELRDTSELIHSGVKSVKTLIGWVTTASIAVLAFEFVALLVDMGHKMEGGSNFSLPISIVAFIIGGLSHSLYESNVLELLIRSYVQEKNVKRIE